jgi:hypothetical protein
MACDQLHRARAQRLSHRDHLVDHRALRGAHRRARLWVYAAVIACWVIGGGCGRGGDGARGEDSRAEGERPKFSAPPMQGPKLPEGDAQEANVSDPQGPLRPTAADAYPDADRDGVPDEVEHLMGTDATDHLSSPLGDGDLLFILPPGGEPYPASAQLRAKTFVQYLDLYFVLDQSASMEEEFAALRHPDKGLSSIIKGLSCARPVDGPAPCARASECPSGFICAPSGHCMEDPARRGCVAEIWTGVGVFGNLDTYQNLLSLQPDPALTAARIPARGVPARPDGPGGLLTGPWAEAPFQPPACVADPSLCLNADTIGCAPDAPELLGCPGFRVHAVRVHMQISDADNQCADPHDRATGTKGDKHFPSLMMGMGRCAAFTAESAGQLLYSAGIRFIGLFGQDLCDYRHPDCDNFPQQLYNDWVRKNAPDRPLLLIHSPRQVAEALALASHSLDHQRRPLAFEARDAAVAARVTAAVQEIALRAPLRVELDVQPVDTLLAQPPATPPGSPSAPPVALDAARLIASIEATHDSEGCAPSPTSDTNGDGLPDAFLSLLPGAVPCWTITPKPFLASPPTTPLTLRATLTVYGDGSPLDQRDILFYIPTR